MLLHKLRLQHGWSQEQLADLAGVSVRTVQRLERGKPASVETLKSLGAVLNVPFHDLRIGHMDSTSKTDDTPPLPNDEVLALRQTRKLRGFYIHLMQYLIVIPVLIAVNAYTYSDSEYPWAVWPAFGWGIGLLFHGLKVFHKIPFLGADWERQQVEKMLGRKL
jgi:transcriptional regulator with XRE-family HTH domain